MIPNPVVETTTARFASRRVQRDEADIRLKTGSPLNADSPERVNKRIAHLAVSELARATSLPTERFGAATGVAGFDVLERIIGRNDLMSITFLDLAVKVARTVARVQIRNAAGQLVGYGTGFMVGPRVLLTNNHVLGSVAEAASSQVEFNYQDTINGLAPASAVFGLDPASLFLTDRGLDYTVVAVREQSGASDVSAFGYNRLVEEEGKVIIGESLNIIQHPNGEPKQLALRENTLIDVLPQFLHYHTDTAPGSSGSPVFNDQWEIVALHHSGVPRTDAQGRYLTKDGTLWTPAMGEHRIDWIANEGARISQIVANVKSAQGLSSTARTLRDSILDARSPIEALGKSVNGSTPQQQSGQYGTAPVVGPDGMATWTLPVQISVRVGGHDAARSTGAVAASAPAAAEEPAAVAGDVFLEKMVAPVIDNTYGDRKGYNENFLGTPIPLPKVTKLSLVSKTEDGEFVIPYQHFSVVMNKKRRLALFTASNVDGRRRSKEPEPGRDYTRKGLSGLGPNDTEKWVTDPRIPESHQLPDVFFTKDRQSFDKGHIIRREDVCWGRSYAMVRRANGDTYHTTNCSPQVKGFNQAGQEGLWGKLENFIMSQAKKETYCLFAGPVFADDDDVFEGVDDRGPVNVQIPSRFWKVVVANSDSGIQAFGFVLEQDLSGVVFREEFAVDSVWVEHLVAIPDLEQMLDGIEFPAVVKNADQFGSPIADEITRRHLESLGVKTLRSGVAAM